MKKTSLSLLLAQNSETHYVAINIGVLRIFKNEAVAIVYSHLKQWFIPNRNGKSKLRIKLHGRYVLAKSIRELAEEIGLSFKKVRNALDFLKKAKVLYSEIHQFKGHPVTHWWFSEGNSEPEEVEEKKEKQAKPSAPLGKSIRPLGQIHSPRRANLTISTTNTTATENPLPPHSGGTDVSQLLETLQSQGGFMEQIASLIQGLLARIHELEHDPPPTPQRNEEKRVARLDPPPPPMATAKVIPIPRRARGTNPRALGTNPRAVSQESVRISAEEKQNRWRKSFADKPTDKPLAGLLTQAVLDAKRKKANAPISA